MITTLPPDLAPLPIRNPDERAPGTEWMHGFVDEAIVAAMISAPFPARVAPVASDLALGACEEDFAGRAVPRSKPVIPCKAVEPGLEAPHAGGHRWWILGLAGGGCTLLFSFLLMTMAWPPVPVEPVQPRVAAPLPMENKSDQLAGR
jgi:hypothetical protein